MANPSTQEYITIIEAPPIKSLAAFQADLVAFQRTVPSYGAELSIESALLSSQKRMWDSLKRMQRRKLSTLPIRSLSECAGQRSANQHDNHKNTKFIVGSYLQRWKITFRGIANSLCEDHHRRLQVRSNCCYRSDCIAQQQMVEWWKLT